MRFYVVNTPDGTGGAYCTLAEAKAALGMTAPEAREAGAYIEGMDVAVNAESIRRLLGDAGGYATNLATVFPTDRSITT